MIWPGVCGFGRNEDVVLRRLAAVEVQEAFDGSLAVVTAATLRSRAPPEFRFCVKASRAITHDDGFKDTPAVAAGWTATRAVAEALRADVLVFEAPDSFGPSDNNRSALYRFFESIEGPASRAIELPRSWATHVVEKICEDLHLVHAVDPFDREPATYGLAYFRLHGPPPNRSSYSEADLLQLETTCREYDDAFAMFGNAAAGDDAIRFASMLRNRPSG